MHYLSDDEDAMEAMYLSEPREETTVVCCQNKGKG